MPNTIKTITATIVTDTNAYASGDFLGTGIINLSAAQNVGGLILHTLSLTDLDKQDKQIDFLFWTSALASTTFTNNSALDVDDAGLLTFAGAFSLLATDYFDLNDNSVACKYGIGLTLNPSSAGLLYCTPVSRGAGTYSASGLQVSFSFLRD